MIQYEKFPSMSMRTAYIDCYKVAYKHYKPIPYTVEMLKGQEGAVTSSLCPEFTPIYR